MIAAYDSATHLHWSSSFTESLREGVVYPRWQGSAFSCRGAPTWVYYPALPYYVPALLSFAGTTVALKLSVGIALFLSGWACFTYLRLFSTSMVSTVGALAYMIFPGHLFQIWPLFFYAGLWSFVFIPLVFRGAHSITKGGHPAALAFPLGGLLLTHLPTAATVIPACLVYIIVTGKLRAKHAWGLGLGVSVSAVYWLPAVAERGRVHSEMFTQWNRFEDNYLFISSHPYGEGWLAVNHLLSIGALVTAMVLVVAAFRLRSLPREMRFWTFLGLATFFAMTPWSSAVWKLIPVAHWLPVPWRLQNLLVLSASVVAAHGLSKRLASRHENLWKFLTWTGLLACAVTSSFAFRTLPFLGVDHHREALETGLYEIGQYRPRAAPAPARREQPAEPCRAPQVNLEGTGSANVTVWENHTKRVEVGLTSPGRLNLRLFAFPGWEATVNDLPSALTTTDKGMIAIDLPPGRHEVALHFRATGFRRVGAWVTWIAVLALVVSVLRGRFGRCSSIT